MFFVPEGSRRTVLEPDILSGITDRNEAAAVTIEARGFTRGYLTPLSELPSRTCSRPNRRARMSD
jgi:hypothetical protein